MITTKTVERLGMDILQSKGILYSKYKQRAIELYPRLKIMQEDFFVATYKCYALFTADSKLLELDEWIHEMHGD